MDTVQPDRPVLIAWHRLGPYHHARLRAAARRLSIIGLEVSTVDKTNAWAPVERADGFRKITLFDNHDVDQASTSEIQTTIEFCLKGLDIGALAVHGWSDRAALLLLDWGLRHQVPVIMMSDSTRDDAQRRMIKEHIKSRVVRLCRAGLVGGTAAERYLINLGIRLGCVSSGYDVVDNEHFARGADIARASADATAPMLGLPDRFVLASSRFVEEKNLFRLLEAFSVYRLRAGEAGWRLVLLGDGPLRGALEVRRSELGLERSVLMPGYKQYEELPSYYGLAGAFVHASTVEPWGLVVNEAMAAGLPVLVSNRCGCAPDLVKDGVNGFTFDPRDVNGLAALIWRLAHSEIDLGAMARASREIIALWGPDRFAEGLAQAVEAACSSPSPAATWIDRLLLRVLSQR